MGLPKFLKNLVSGNRKEELNTPEEPFNLEEKQVLYKSEFDNELGDCRCVHCHRDFWYEDFLGICASRHCNESNIWLMNLEDMNFYPETGPRRILLREQTKEKFSAMQDMAIIEDVLKTKSHICPVCNSRFYFYACPYCRHAMPRMKKEDLHNTMAPAGIGFSGKTTYMTVLIRQLIKKPILRNNFKVISNFVEKNDFQRYMEKYSKLHIDKECLESTQQGEHPLPYLLRTTSRRMDSKKDTKAFTLWYDFSGEAFELAEQTNPILQYFASVGGIFLFVDPTNSSNVMNSLKIKLKEGIEVEEMRDVAVQTQIHSILSKAGGSDEAPRKKLIAVIVNKIDVFRNKNFPFFDDTSIIWQPSPHQARGAFCLDDFNIVNKEVRSYVEMNHSEVYGQLELFKNADASNIGFFAVSSLGHIPVDWKQIENPIEPLRIEDPFYWMLWKMGHLPAVGEEEKETDYVEVPGSVPILETEEIGKTASDDEIF